MRAGRASCRSAFAILPRGSAPRGKHRKKAGLWACGGACGYPMAAWDYCFVVTNFSRLAILLNRAEWSSEMARWNAPLMRQCKVVPAGELLVTWLVIYYFSNYLGDVVIYYLQ